MIHTFGKGMESIDGRMTENLAMLTTSVVHYTGPHPPTLHCVAHHIQPVLGYMLG
jgi:hypothetical protein